MQVQDVGRRKHCKGLASWIRRLRPDASSILRTCGRGRTVGKDTVVKVRARANSRA